MQVIVKILKITNKPFEISDDGTFSQGRKQSK